MFCQACGSTLANGALVCGSCSAPVAASKSSFQGSGAASAAGSLAAPAPASAHTQRAKAALATGLGALKSLAPDPVGRLSRTYGELGEAGAQRAGVVLGLFSLACWLIGGYLLLPFREDVLDILGFGGVVKLVAFAAVPFGVIAAGLAIARRVAGSRAAPASNVASPGLGADLFVAGATVLPISLAMLAGGILGSDSPKLDGLIALFAWSTTILMLAAGAREVARLSPRATTILIPLVVLGVIWIDFELASSILGGALGLGGDLGGPAGFPGFAPNGMGAPRGNPFGY